MAISPPDGVEDGGELDDDVAGRLSDEESDALRLLTWGGEPYHEYIERIATTGNRLAVMVKRADLLDNLRPCRNCPEHLQPRYQKALSRLHGLNQGQ